MARVNNYLVQVRQAQERFLGYDQQALMKKLKLQGDDNYIYVKLLCKTYRIARASGLVDRLEETWVDANTHEEVMTLLDLVCDSRPDRYISHRWKIMQSFGLMFHQNLAEGKNPFAEAIQKDPQGFRRACEAMDGEPIDNADIAYAIELFDGLRICIQFWERDEEFEPRVRYLWDENALMYLKYETMYFAINLLMKRITGLMQKRPLV